MANGLQKRYRSAARALIVVLVGWVMGPHAVLAQAAHAQWEALGRVHWISDGRANAPRAVYVFTGPNCPYCNKFWSDARPWVDTGKVQLRHVLVGILTPTSAGKVAALLLASDPAAALDAYERRNAFGVVRSIASGQAKALSDATLKPMEPVPARIQNEIDANERLMAKLGLRATPAFAWRGPSGELETRTGIPQGGLDRMLGPR